MQGHAQHSNAADQYCSVQMLQNGFLHNHWPNLRVFTESFSSWFSTIMDYRFLAENYFSTIVYYRSFLQCRRLRLERRKERIIFWRCPSLNSGARQSKNFGATTGTNVRFVGRSNSYFQPIGINLGKVWCALAVCKAVFWWSLAVEQLYKEIHNQYVNLTVSRAEPSRARGGTCYRALCVVRRFGSTSYQCHVNTLAI